MLKYFLYFTCRERLRLIYKSSWFIKTDFFFAAVLWIYVIFVVQFIKNKIDTASCFKNFAKLIGLILTIVLIVYSIMILGNKLLLYLQYHMRTMANRGYYCFEYPILI